MASRVKRAAKRTKIDKQGEQKMRWARERRFQKAQKPAHLSAQAQPKTGK
jgi:hypothetical protein